MLLRDRWLQQDASSPLFIVAVRSVCLIEPIYDMFYRVYKTLVHAESRIIVIIVYYAVIVLLDCCFLLYLHR